MTNVENSFFLRPSQLRATSWRRDDALQARDLGFPALHRPHVFGTRKRIGRSLATPCSHALPPSIGSEAPFPSRFSVDVLSACLV